MRILTFSGCEVEVTRSVRTIRRRLQAVAPGVEEPNIVEENFDGECSVQTEFELGKNRATNQIGLEVQNGYRQNCKPAAVRGIFIVICGDSTDPTGREKDQRALRESKACRKLT